MKLTKKEICIQNKAFAYYSGFGGLEMHYVEYGIEDYIYCKSGAWYGKKSYHKLKIYYEDDYCYIKLHGYEIPLHECIRINNKGGQENEY